MLKVISKISIAVVLVLAMSLSACSKAKSPEQERENVKIEAENQQKLTNGRLEMLKALGYTNVIQTSSDNYYYGDKYEMTYEIMFPYSSGVKPCNIKGVLYQKR